MKYEFTQFFDFIVIDDSKLDLLIAQKMLKRIGENFSVQTFEQATDALEMIIQRPALPSHKRTILLIDLRMPLMDGFQFVEKFSELCEGIRSQYIPCILTSSISESDRSRANAMPVIQAFLNKPPDAAMLQSLMRAYITAHELTVPDA